MISISPIGKGFPTLFNKGGHKAGEDDEVWIGNKSSSSGMRGGFWNVSEGPEEQV